jgi:hypothetical protein
MPTWDVNHRRKNMPSRYDETLCLYQDSAGGRSGQAILSWHRHWWGPRQSSQLRLQIQQLWTRMLVLAVFLSGEMMHRMLSRGSPGVLSLGVMLIPFVTIWPRPRILLCRYGQCAADPQGDVALCTVSHTATLFLILLLLWHGVFRPGMSGSPIQRDSQRVLAWHDVPATSSSFRLQAFLTPVNMPLSAADIRLDRSAK